MPRKQLKLTDFFSEKEGLLNSGSEGIHYSKRGDTLPVQSRVLALVEDAGESGISIASISHITNFKRQNIFKALNKLMKKGLVDRKNHFYFLTEDGKKQQELDNKRKKERIPPSSLGSDTGGIRLGNFDTSLPLFSVHHVRLIFPLRAGKQPCKNSHRQIKMRGWTQFVWYFPSLTISAYLHSVKMEFFGVQREELEDNFRGLLERFGGIIKEFCDFHGIVLGEPSLAGKIHYVLENKRLGKPLQKLIEPNSLGITMDKSHFGKVEAMNVSEEQIRDWEWLIENAGKVRVLEEKIEVLSYVMNEFAIQIKRHLNILGGMEKGVNGLVREVQNLSNKVNELNEAIKNLIYKIN